MRLALFLAASVACLATAPAAMAQSPWSPLRYKAPDGYVWDARSGVWRSPSPVLDRTTGRREYLTRQPSSTACCDKTGLSFPMGSVNEDIGTAAPVERKQATRKPRYSLRAALKERLAREADDTDSQIAGVRAMESVSEEAKASVIRDLESKRARRGGGGRVSDDADTGGGSASSLYGSLAGQSASQLEGTARNRRHDPSNDMTFGDVMGAVGGGLAAGVAIGGRFRPSQSVRSGQVARSAPAPARTQVRRVAPPVYSGGGTPRRGSDISGTGQ